MLDDADDDDDGDDDDHDDVSGGSPLLTVFKRLTPLQSPFKRA